MSVGGRSFIARRSTRLFILIVVVVLGIGIAAFFGVRAVRSFREVQYIHQQGLDRGTASVDAVRPWMTIRFIAVAYAVPEEYLYSALNIEFDRRNADDSLGELNKEYNLGFVQNGTELAIIDHARTAITTYRQNPVATGLRDVRLWMSVQYIANGSGVPAEYIFTKIGIPQAGNEYKPLDLIVREQHYEGGPRALELAIQQALTEYGAQP